MRQVEECCCFIIFLFVVAQKFNPTFGEFNLTAIMQETLEPIRTRRKEFEQDIPAIYAMLKKGCEQAREAAAQTLDDVRRAMKINYFDDVELIAEQSRKFHQ